MSGSNGNSKIVDIKELKEIMDNDLELIQDCFADFLSEWPALFEEIKDAINQKDADKIDSSAHKLKGTLKYLAAEPAANAAMAIESAGSNHDMENLDQKLLILKKECETLVDFINSFDPSMGL
jgi:HPt (histidine-containing phosphotransfer) domain-containing protein